MNNQNTAAASAKPQTAAAPKTFTTIDGNSLMAQEYEPLQFIEQGWGDFRCQRLLFCCPKLRILIDSYQAILTSSNRRQSFSQAYGEML